MSIFLLQRQVEIIKNQRDLTDLIFENINIFNYSLLKKKNTM